MSQKPEEHEKREKIANIAWSVVAMVAGGILLCRVWPSGPASWGGMFNNLAATVLFSFGMFSLWDTLKLNSSLDKLDKWQRRVIFIMLVAIIVVVNALPLFLEK